MIGRKRPIIGHKHALPEAVENEQPTNAKKTAREQ
jgi:hypothetical protein